MDVIDADRNAADAVEAALAAVPTDRWGTASRCPEWTLRDVAAHLTWGRRVIAAAASGVEYPERWGAPGAPSPGGHLGDDDPAQAFRDARAAADAAIAAGGLSKPAPEFLRAADPEATAGSFAAILVADQLAHAWDVASVVGAGVDVDADTLAFAVSLTRSPARTPAMFAAAVTPPDDATDYEKFLAFLGRDPRAGR